MSGTYVGIADSKYMKTKHQLLHINGTQLWIM